MSRHVIRDDDSYEIAVGWDPPLRTYFAQVYDKEAFREALEGNAHADEVLTVWIGGKEPWIKEPEGLIVALAPYVKLDDEMLLTLREDQSG